ncbi:Dihydroxyacetone kinase [Lasiodiplodia theobromae]|uniref:Dihydroxyacetone kinase n=1 Tax=Lasiodiplodia theobromae TaxID=45133 RepID=UPI0015C2C7B4|nr:Dihydroxyacetone kinase [Lasiodiplodia theobromae]KAF4543860.1 Dihydroxyacetone kinase [Lasiodiplodia theobromae]
MSTKHFFPDTNGLVVRALNSIVARNPHLEHDEANRVVFSKTHPPSKVSIISGGGSGHEPAWAGYVGDGMLTAAVAGEVFASPSTKQVMAAIRNVPSDAGVILCITNYTGDRLHFGLAREKMHAMGHNIAQIPLTDDVALGRKKSELLGRRGLAGNVLVLKLLGAAAHESWNFEDCWKLGTEVNAQLATIGTSLDHCHIPGRAHHEQIEADTCVLGMGIHNEPGLRKISPMPTPQDLIKEMLLYVLDPNDSDRAFVKFDQRDEIALVINNFGGLSNLELEALTQIALEQLEQDWKIKPSRIYSGIFETSLNGPGFSLTLGNLSNVASAVNRPVSKLLELLDAPTTAPAWPRSGYSQPVSISKESSDRREKARAEVEQEVSDVKGPEASPSLLHALRTACSAALTAEPDITKFDIQMGDGDCGEAVAGVCNALLTSMKASPFITKAPCLVSCLASINSDLEDMGGSLGAILSILLTAFAGNLQRGVNASGKLDIGVIGDAAGKAMEALKAYTGARVGDRTVMDTLIPWCETLQATRDVGKALAAAEEGAKKTAGMKPRFGRATYVGEMKEGEQMPPDPGAYAVAVFLRGLVEGGAWA